ncbi:hypothetical protein BGZ65_010610, partial [Modicella reniformis]
MITTKPFLFRFFQNARLQGHYIFRVVEDRIEYKVLPKALEQACSQYFHKAYLTYRDLEKKAKALKSEKDSKRIRPFWTPPSRSQQALFENSFTDVGNRINNSGGGGGGGGINFRTERRGSEGSILKSAIAWDQTQNIISPAPFLTSSPTTTAPPDIFPNRMTGYQDQRYNPQRSQNAIIRSFAGGPGGVGRGWPERANSAPVEKNISTGIIATVRFDDMSLTPPPLPPRPKTFHTRNRSWTNIKEQPRLDQKVQQIQEEPTLSEKERRLREEFKQATYGLQLYLNEIIRGLEYERFDASADVAITNDNRNSAVFSIVNGDLTNEMWLESPSVKLKYEFINWIDISTMGHNEANNQEPVSAAHDNLQNNKTSLMDLERERSEEDSA